MPGHLDSKDLTFPCCPILPIAWYELDFFPPTDEKFNKTKVYKTHEQMLNLLFGLYCLSCISFLSPFLPESA